MTFPSTGDPAADQSAKFKQVGTQDETSRVAQPSPRLARSSLWG